MIDYLRILDTASNTFFYLNLLNLFFFGVYLFTGREITVRKIAAHGPAYYMRIARMQGMIQAAACACTCGNPNHVLDILGELEQNAVKVEKFQTAADLRDAAAYYRKEILSKVK